tara:strand:+ start:5033 stop:5254 length:222 start_codon:yes stop_codon:yes gene_type:complete
MVLNLVTNKAEEDAHLRGQSRFYVAGWIANRECENPQEMPKECEGNKVVEEWHKEYLTGYGDSVANGECLMNR